jgi:hypothetical protein
MDIVQLKSLVYVAELGSLSKASEKLNIVQPALSRHIKLLEQELGARCSSAMLVGLLWAAFTERLLKGNGKHI